jgi:malate dehydrogenase (oxaloacetate-decarboxylating)(NADP+)
MAPDVALDEKVMKNYPFSRLSGPANVLVMPGLQSGNISAKLLKEVGGESVIGPMLVGMEKPVQIATDVGHRRRSGDAGRARSGRHRKMKVPGA